MAGDVDRGCPNLAYGAHSRGPLLREQYDAVRGFLDEIAAHLGLKPEELPVLMVPGNHDVDRAKVRAGHGVARQMSRQTGASRRLSSAQFQGVAAVPRASR